MDYEEENYDSDIERDDHQGEQEDGSGDRGVSSFVDPSDSGTGLACLPDDLLKSLPPVNG